ncbi:hypothetical protein ENSA7_28870 [Enhygromyxa salina]|uniref:Uncharacterized protein n=1 Tax=Enhygromyxa salina TaxID=215803 RepID=A0A2S9YQP8_9BACT|nr:hypothetical protein ENSA7_28870 [Enhygromyxa salina]
MTPRAIQLLPQPRPPLGKRHIITPSIRRLLPQFPQLQQKLHHSIELLIRQVLDRVRRHVLVPLRPAKVRRRSRIPNRPAQPRPVVVVRQARRLFAAAPVDLVTRRTVLLEQRDRRKLRIILPDRAPPRRRHAQRRELAGARGVLVRSHQPLLIVLIVRVSHNRQRGQNHDPTHDQPHPRQHRAPLLGRPRLRPINEGQRKQKRRHPARNDHRRNDRQRPLEVLQQLKQKQKIPLGPRHEVRGRIRRRKQLGPVGAIGDRHQHRPRHRHRGHVDEQLVGPKRLGLGRQLLVAQRRWRRHPMTPKQIEVHTQQRRERDRQHEHMQRIEPGNRQITILRPTLQRVLQQVTKRHRPHDPGRDLRRPVPLLIPRQQVAGQRKRQHQPTHREAGPPVELTRLPIRPREHHLHQVQDRDDHHHRRSVVMQPTQEPPAGDPILQVRGARPRVARRRAIIGSQQDPQHDLLQEQVGQHAAKHIAHAGATWNLLVERLLGERPNPRTLVDPVHDPHQTFTLASTPCLNRS